KKAPRGTCFRVCDAQVAETMGFEPTRRFPAYSLSRGAPSTTRPRLRGRVCREVPGQTRRNRPPFRSERGPREKAEGEVSALTDPAPRDGARPRSEPGDRPAAP